jgi:polar amino acid transport system substrate-binding protein
MALAVTLLLLFVCSFTGFASAQTTPREVRVAVRVLEPFVMKVEGGGFTGFSIDLWNEIARANDYRTTFVEVTTVGELLDAVQTAKADVAITAISITAERTKLVQFSEPMFNGGLQIAVPAARTRETGGIWVTLRSPAVLAILALMVLSIFVAALVVWLIERKDNPDFAHSGAKGIFEGMWWAVVTLLTVGYGDRVTKSVAGRFFSMIFMLFGVLLVATFTATFTASLTVHDLQTDIQGVSDLQGRKVVTVKGTTAASYLSGHQIAAREVGSVGEMIEQLDSGDLDAAVYDAPVLAYAARQSDGARIHLVGAPFTREYYGIAEAIGSDLGPGINSSLLSTYSNGFYNRLYSSWFST